LENNPEDFEWLIINGKHVFIDSKGKLLIPPKFDFAGWPVNNSFTYGLALIEKNEKYGYINTKGDVVIPPRFVLASDFSANGLALIQENKLFGFINAKGEMVIPPRFVQANGFSANGLALIQENKLFGFINAQGEMVIPAQYEEAGSFAANGLARVKENGKYGFINAQGVMVILPQFMGADDFAANGLAAVWENKKYGFINSQGEMVIPPRFESIALRGFSNGLLQVKENEKYGFVNAKGEMVIPPKFESAGNFAANGLTWVQEEENKKYGYINVKGEMVIPPRFDTARNFTANGLAYVWENSKPAYINAQGQTIVSLDTVCYRRIIKNSRGKIIWPEKVDTKVCELTATEDHYMKYKEFMQKLEAAQPWTREKMEAIFGIKFTQTSLGSHIILKANGQFVFVKDLIANRIYVKISEDLKNRDTLFLEIDYSKSNCFMRKQIEKIYPGEYIDIHVIESPQRPVYYKSQGHTWGRIIYTYNLDFTRDHCLDSITIEVYANKREKNEQ